MEISVQHKIITLCTQQKDLLETFKPSFYRIYNPEERLAFSLLLDTPGIRITDSVIDQVKELMKITYPDQKLNDKQQEAAALQHIQPYTPEDYGVWVYYPWSNRLVHIVDEKEFIDLRTSRNQYKITKEERELLAQKKIGVIGLSVGQSVAITLAMERGAGELRLADFDVLELTNLNRIRTGIHNLGLPKVFAVAREIAEIDPFLSVICFNEGLSENNLDTFFMGNGKLDLLIEESDGFDIKILSRYKAKELRVPVIMETSDRCMVDVERFDLHPDLSILHGFVNHLSIENLKNIKTTEDKIPYILDILGLETSSTRLKASMMEIDETITTWPQLASSVAMGGGITADISRRLLLNTFTDSGRYYIDIEQLIPSQEQQVSYTAEDLTFPSLEYEEMLNIANNCTCDATHRLSDSELEKIVKAAIHAPSAGNNQPWKWLSLHGNLFLFHDQQKSISWSDHRHLISNISFGTALENVIIQSEEIGYKATYTLFPNEKEIKLVAVVSFEPIAEINTYNQTLAPYLFSRHTNRKKGTQQKIQSSYLSDLITIGQHIKNVTIDITSNDEHIQHISKIVSAVEKIRFLIPQAHHDFFSKEIQWNKNEQEVVEGLAIKTLEVTSSQEAGLRIASDPKVIELLNEWKKGSGFAKLSRDTIVTSSAIGLISVPSFTDEHWINGGRALERIWLLATKLNIALHPISAPLFLYEILKQGGKDTIPFKDQHEIEKQYALLAEIFPTLKNKEGVFLFRMSEAESPSAKSLKKSVNELYFKTNF